MDTLPPEELIAEEAYQMATDHGLGAISCAALCARMRLKPIKLAEHYPNVAHLRREVLRLAVESECVPLLVDGVRNGWLDCHTLPPRLARAVRRARECAL